jgi:aminoglycoside phosphotransferase (APT) family kinase protein
LPALLAAHGLEAVTEDQIAHAGYSGSQVTRLRRADGASFVLKRMSIETDWIMRATADVACREAQFAARIPPLPPAVRVPYMGAAHGDGAYAVLMHDIAPDLVPPDAPVISHEQLDRVLTAMAVLHAMTIPPDGIAWCGVRERLTLLTPSGASIAQSYGAPVARDVLGGWRLFADLAPGAAVSLIHRLFDDPAPLLRALGDLPAALLHGDLKLDNIGLDGAGAMWLIDWAMTLVAPPAVDLGWFLAINSRRLPGSLDDVLARYATAARLPGAHRDRHDAIVALCGLVLRGWRKALDAAAGEPAELAWWCERALAAGRYL